MSTGIVASSRLLQLHVHVDKSLDMGSMYSCSLSSTTYPHAIAYLASRGYASIDARGNSKYKVANSYCRYISFLSALSRTLH
jgi:hypothetical protein